MTPTFPAEILDSIIDSLASEHPFYLKECSLVSREFLPRTRSHIYKYITIHSRDPPTPLMFARLISQNPDIAYYVKDLGYHPREYDDALITESFATALGSLTRLKRLRVVSNVLWKDLPCREIILNLIHLPTLSHFELRLSRGFHVSDLALCTGLKSFKMFNSGAVEQCGEVGIYSEVPPRLESYKGSGLEPSGGMLMQFCTTLRTDGKPMIDMTGLKELSVDVDEPDALAQCFKLSTQLTDVHLSGCQNLSGFKNLFLPLLQTLQHIHLDFHVLPDEDPFPPFISGFASFAGKNIIQRIKFSIYYHFHRGLTCGDEWDALDRVFTLSESDWRYLRFFKLHLAVTMYRNVSDEDTNFDDFLQDLRTLPQTQLKGLVQSRDITLDFDVSTY